MRLFLSINELIYKAKDTFRRFPVVLIWAIAGTVFTLYLIGEEPNKLDPYHFNYLLTAILGVSWLIAARFFIEQLKNNKHWLVLITLLFLFLFYWHLPIDNDYERSIDYWIRFAMYLIAGHIFVLVAPFIVNYDKNTYWNYLKSVFLAILRSLLYTLIIYLGIVLALLAIKYLFNVEFEDKRFFQVFVLCLGIINTWIYLSDFPKEIHSNNTIDFIKALEVLVKYILIPLVILYLIILYAYSFKILIEWNLPKGWVSYLVTALAFLGFFIQILINPVQNDLSSSLIKKFQPWFYLLLLPLVILLFVAIFTRINDYGFTENRYFVLALACWVLGMSVYMLLNKQKQIRFFGLSLVILILLISFGPWGAFSVSTKSQLHEFTKVYLEIKKKDFKITPKENEQFTSIVRYLFDKKQLDLVKPVLGFEPTKELDAKYSYRMAEKLKDTLNVEVIYDPKTDFHLSSYRIYNLDQNNLIPIKGYDFIKLIRFETNNKNNFLDYTLKLDVRNNVNIYKSGKLVKNVTLNYLINDISLKESTREVSPKKMTVLIKSDSLDAKLIFKEINLNYLSKTKDSLPTIRWATAYILLKDDAKQD